MTERIASIIKESIEVKQAILADESLQSQIEEFTQDIKEYEHLKNNQSQIERLQYDSLEKLPEARYHLLMSERHGFHSKELSLNQEIVESKLGVSKYENPLTLTDYVARGGLIGGQGYFTTLALFFLVIAIWILRKKDRLKSSLFYLTFSVIFVGLNFWVHRWDQSIVVSPKVIHDGPSSLFGERGELPLGVMLITTENEDWIKIIYPSRFEGWTKRDGLKELR
jgi:hypothetical protein